MEIAGPGTDVIRIDSNIPEDAERAIIDYAEKRFVFDNSQLKINSDKILPKMVDVAIVGAGVTGLYAANQFIKNNISIISKDNRTPITLWGEK